MELKVETSCVGCGKCVKDCPVGVLEMKDGRPAVREGKDGQCMNCQHCLAVCPEGALAVNGVGADDCRPLSQMPIPPPNELANLLMSRRSVRQFAHVNVPRADIEEILEALKYVPTGCNIRHLVFSVVGDVAKMDDLRRRVIAALDSHGDSIPDFLKGPLAAAKKDPSCDPFFRNAPHLLLVKGDPSAVTPLVDCAADCAYFDLLAQSHGLGVTWSGFLQHIVDAAPEVRDLFGVPRNAPFYAMMFGEPVVDYARCVNRSAGARVEWL